MDCNIVFEFLQLPKHRPTTDQILTFPFLFRCRNASINIREIVGSSSFLFFINQHPGICLTCLEKTGDEKIRLINYRKSWIWHQYLPENRRWFFWQYQNESKSSWRHTKTAEWTDSPEYFRCEQTTQSDTSLLQITTPTQTSSHHGSLQTEE